MKRAGAFEVTAAVLTRLRLDGGAMFGSVPRAVWDRHQPADERNRIALVARVLVLRSADRQVLVDAGCGDKFGPREADQYAIEAVPAAQLPFRWDELTDIVLTHLHFDHAGGISRWSDAPEGTERKAILSAPRARVHLQTDNWLLARSPGPRERASYLAENVLPLESAHLELARGPCEPLPGLSVHPSHGHTRGMQWVQVGTGRGSIVFPADIIPTASHLHLPFVMGYDMCVETLLREKEDLLRRAAEEEWTIVFAHDSKVAAGRVERAADGRFRLAEEVSL